MTKHIRLLKLLFVLALVTTLVRFSSLPPAHAQDGGGYFAYYSLIRQDEGPAWLGPDGGSVVALATDPTNASIVYAGSWGNGVYKSTNGGSSWAQANTGMGGQWIDSLVVDPTNPNILYAGTQAHGLFKSTNAAASWYSASNGMRDHSVVYSLAVNPGNHNLVYAGTRVEGTLNGFLYKSTDGGAYWNTVLTFDSDWIYSLAVDPSSPNIIIAAAHEHGPYIAQSYGGSGDWNPTNVYNDDCPNDECLKGRAVAFDPRSWMSRAYYGAWHGDFFRANDNGWNWWSSNNGLGTSHIYPNGIVLKPSSLDTLYLAVHGSDSSSAYSGNVYRSGDGGSSWQGTNLSGKTVYSVAAPTGSGDTVLAGTYSNGLYRSTNGGGNWSLAVKGLVNSQVTGLVFPDGSTIYASAIGGGVSRSTDGGKTWTSFNNNLGDLNVNGLVLHPANPNLLFALTNGAGLRKFDLSAGTGWTTGSAALTGPSQVLPERSFPSPFTRREPIDELREFEQGTANPSPSSPSAVTPPDAGTAGAVSSSVNTLVFAPFNANYAYVGTNSSGVYASTNSAQTWTQVGLSGISVYSIAVSPTSPTTLYAATSKAGLIKTSTNSGKTWTDMPLPSSGLSMHSVIIWPNQANGLLVGTNNGVWKYNGTSWTAAGLQGINVKQLKASPFNPDAIYAATNTGGFVSYDLSNWTYHIAEMNDNEMETINFDPADPARIYFGTTYRGTLRVTLP